MARHLILRLEAPLMSFGGIAVDNYGIIRDFPAASMLTGLIGNALGWHRRDREKLQALQDRLVFAARLDREPAFLQDTQNARLYQKDAGWTTWGGPEGRASSPSYKAVDEETPKRGNYLLQRRFRDYHADAFVTIALRLVPADLSPTLEEVAAAFDRPARPLFLGRKPCIPTRPILDVDEARWIEATTVYDALCAIPFPETEPKSIRAQWPATDGPNGHRQISLSDERNWLSGIHSGTRLVIEGSIMPLEGEEKSR